MSHDIGQIITNLGVSADQLAEDAMVTDAVVLLKCVQADGSVTMMLAHSEGMSWIERVGMLRIAERLEGDAGSGWSETD